MAPPLFTAAGLSKAYGAPVLREVSIDLRRGEVHALVGENGAGKSTLSRIIAGLARPDAGAMSLGGVAYAPRSRSEGQRAGVAMVTQELGLLPTLTVGESLFLDRLPHRLGIIDRARLAADARRALLRVGLGSMNATRPVTSLSVAARQLVEIAGALDRAADVLILDEPTSALSAGDAAQLFEQVRRLRNEGRSVVFSHRLAEVERIADRVTVLRDGAVVATRDAPTLARDEMVRMMVGRDVAESPRRQGAPSTLRALRTEGLSGRGFRDVSLEVRRGEVLGLAGLMGAGRTELLRVLFGADRPTEGAIYVGDSAEAATISSPREALAQGVALLTEDRKGEGLLLPLSVRANITLARLRDLAGPSGAVDSLRENEVVSRFSGLLGIRARSPEQPVDQLSGGNQQKVLLARWLYRDPAVLLVDEPTRGIDVASRAEIHRLLGALADGGKAVVVASSDLEELLALSDRIVVLSAGRVTQAFDRGAWTADGIMAAALRGHEREATA